MASCLGIHISDKILKYAKLTIDNSKNVSLEQHGVKFIQGNKIELIKKIIAETQSEDIPIALSTYDDYYQKVQVFKQLAKADIKNVINLEFEDWCEKKSSDASKYQYTYFLPDSVVGDYYNGVINIIEKEEVEVYKDTKNVNVASIMPTPFTMNEIIPKDEKNYVLINFDDRLYMTSVIDGKVVEFVVEEIGMKDIFTKLIDFLGSEQKVYEACKKINVFSEGESTNQKDIEEVTEPVLQEILKRISEVVTRRKSSVNKVFVTGMGTLFTNIDILFREYLDIKTELLKPPFMSDVGGVRNVAEALEAIPAMSIAYQYLNPTIPNIEQYKKSAVNSLFAMFTSKAKNPKEKKEAKEKSKDKTSKPMIAFAPQKIAPIMICLSIVVVLTMITYLVFSNIYISQINKMKKDLDDKTAKLVTQTNLISTDISYINSNTSQYKGINDDVQKTVELIEGNQIGKYSTYNIASFMQKIIKIIPKNVQLKTISSDDNKKVKISAQSTLYSDLGYFVAQLKLQGVLNNVKVNTIKNGTTIEVEIGGDLP